MAAGLLFGVSVMGTSFISGQADVALVELCRGARLAENTLEGTSKNCANRAAGVGRTGHSAAGA